MERKATSSGKQEEPFLVPQHLAISHLSSQFYTSDPFGTLCTLREHLTSLSTGNKDTISQRPQSPWGAEEEAVPRRTMGALSAQARETQQSNKSSMLSW